VNVNKGKLDCGKEEKPEHKEDSGTDGKQEHVKYVQLALASLMLDWKNTFIHRHTSPFREQYEERTCAHAVFTNLLRLPLSLPGSHSQVLYPDLGFRGPFTDGGQPLTTSCRIENMMRRFIEGGTLVFENPDDETGQTVVTRRIPRMSLAFFGELVRYPISFVYYHLARPV
jgi:hypothetical protein